MNIIGIGTDIVSVTRIKKIWDRYGAAFARHILSKKELEAFTQVTNPIGFLAKRFAAKEAVAKALGTGFRPHGVLLTDIEVFNDLLGKPQLHFTGGAEREMNRLGVEESQLSLSDEKEFALAFVVLIGKKIPQ